MPLPHELSSSPSTSDMFISLAYNSINEASGRRSVSTDLDDFRVNWVVESDRFCWSG